MDLRHHCSIHTVQKKSAEGRWRSTGSSSGGSCQGPASRTAEGTVRIAGGLEKHRAGEPPPKWASLDACAKATPRTADASAARVGGAGRRGEGGRAQRVIAGGRTIPPAAGRHEILGPPLEIPLEIGAGWILDFLVRVRNWLAGSRKAISKSRCIRLYV